MRRLVASALILAACALASGAASAAISYVATGATANGGGGGSYTPPLPAGIVANDILILIVSDSSGAIAAPAGWTSKIGDASGINVMWRRATGTDTAPTVPEGGYGMGFIYALRGCVATGDPFDVAGAVLTVYTVGAQALPAITVAANSWVSMVSITGGSTATLTITSTACPTNIMSSGPTGAGNRIITANTASAPSVGGSTGASTFTNGGNSSQASAVYFSLAAAPAGGGSVGWWYWGNL